MIQRRIDTADATLFDVYLPIYTLDLRTSKKRVYMHRVVGVGVFPTVLYVPRRSISESSMRKRKKEKERRLCGTSSWEDLASPYSPITDTASASLFLLLTGSIRGCVCDSLPWLSPFTSSLRFFSYNALDKRLWLSVKLFWRLILTNAFLVSFANDDGNHLVSKIFPGLHCKKFIEFYFDFINIMFLDESTLIHLLVSLSVSL